MPVRTTVLGRGNSGTAQQEVTIYTCPAGETAILKDVRCSVATGNPTRIVVFLVSGATRSSLIDQALAAGEKGLGGLFAVLLPGDQIRIFSQGGSFDAWCSGAELEGLAD